MKTVQVPAFVFMTHGWNKDFSQQEWSPELWSCRVDDNEYRVFINEQTVTVEVPEDFNPVPAQVAALEKAKAEALAAYQKTVGELNDRLSKLLALTNEAHDQDVYPEHGYEVDAAGTFLG